MESLADALPPEIAKLIHPDWRKNEADYWKVRDTLLAQYRNQWVGFANGKVIVSGTSAVDVLHDTDEKDPHSYVTCVGHEDEPARVRVAFAYDREYLPEALPVVPVEFRRDLGTQGTVFDHVLVDTVATC